MRPAACAPRRNNSTELGLIMITELVGGGVKIKIKIKTEIAITIKIRESRRHPRENCTQLSGQNPKQPLQPPCLRPLVQLSLLPLLPFPPQTRPDRPLQRDRRRHPRRVTSALNHAANATGQRHATCRAGKLERVVTHGSVTKSARAVGSARLAGLEQHFTQGVSVRNQISSPAI